MVREPFIIKEHQSFHDKEAEELRSLNLELSYKNDRPKQLGLSSDLRVGYYIGTQWLVEDEYALVVEPKIDNLNYLAMFMECLHNPRTSSHVRKIYAIDFNQKPIPLKADQFELTPLIIIHFLTLMKGIVQKGLKRDYIWIEDNLQSKIKGKLLVNQNIKKNIVKNRADRNVCRYQEYSVDCTENRVLKKTLNYVFTYITASSNKNREMLNLYNFVHPAFFSVSDEVSLHEMKSIKTNSLFKEYNEALRVAGMILKRFSYSIHNTEKTEENFPPFYIDMSLLFEMYVLTKLDKEYGRDILFQCAGSKKTSLDFLLISEKTIIDTKYKKCYCSENGWKKEDIRQLSGYARDIKILNNLDIDFSMPIPSLDCLIIYPDQGNGLSEIVSSNLKSSTIKEFINFYKYGISLPTKKRGTTNA